MDKIGKSTLDIMGNAKWYNGYLLKSVSNYLKGNILEVGFGTGNYSMLLSKYGHLTAIEMNRDYINGIKKENNISFGYGDIEKGKYFFGEDNKFKTIICLNVLEHIKDDISALKNICKLLKSDGNLILLVPAHKTLFSGFDKSIGHFRRYAKSDLSEKFGKAGLTIKSLKHFNWLGAVGWFIFMKLMGKRSLPGKGVSFFDKIARYAISFEKNIEPPFGLSLVVVARRADK